MNNLLKTYKSMCINVDAIAELIEMRCGHFLTPAPEGLYYEGILNPVIVRGEQYVYVTDSGQVKPLEHIDHLPADAVSIYRQLSYPSTPIVSPQMLKSPGRMWSPIPTLPYRGMYAILACGREYIQDITSHGAYDDNGDVWDTLLAVDQLEAVARQSDVLRLDLDKLTKWSRSGAVNIGEYIGERVIGMIRRHTRPVYERILDFVGPHVDNIYTVNFKGAELFIEQKTDWRAIAWETHQLQLQAQLQE